jgi:hypothetical protein
MKKQLLAAIMATGLLAVSSVSSWGQTANFVYNDNSGAPNAGTYHPGDSFTFSIQLLFTPGGSISNLDGLSYWLQQQSPASPFIASVTLRDVTGSMFTDLQTPGLTYPQNLSPSNASDLGGAIPVGMPPGSEAVGAGLYQIANITVQISPTAPIFGTYTLSQTLTGGKTSVIADSNGHTFAIPEADYTITLVPEPGTWAGAALTLVALLSTQGRRILRRRRTA